MQNDDDRFRSTYLKERAISNFASLEQQTADPIARYRDQYKASGEGYSRPESQTADYSKPSVEVRPTATV